jgi:uncharacterized membrane protein YeaQ/YmgE (transglycosylase-associated protein family)
MDLMTLAAWLLLGLIAGVIAGMLVGGAGGILTSIVVGIIGAFIGGWLGSMFFGQPVTGLNVPSILLAILGAVILLLILRLIPRGRPVV